MRRDDSLMAFVAILVVIVGLVVYFVVDAFGKILSLNWSAAAFLLFGLIVLVAAIGFVLLQGYKLSRLFLWMLCGFYPFTLPALNYWALDMPSRLFVQINADVPVETLWYGQGWWQLLMFIGLVTCAYGWNRVQGEHYR